MFPKSACGNIEMNDLFIWVFIKSLGSSLFHHWLNIYCTKRRPRQYRDKLLILLLFPKRFHDRLNIYFVNKCLRTCRNEMPIWLHVTNQKMFLLIPYCSSIYFVIKRLRQYRYEHFMWISSNIYFAPQKRLRQYRAYVQKYAQEYQWTSSSVGDVS